MATAVILLPIAEMPVPTQSRRNGFESSSGEMSTGTRRSQPAKRALGLEAFGVERRLRHRRRTIGTVRGAAPKDPPPEPGSDRKPRCRDAREWLGRSCCRLEQVPRPLGEVGEVDAAAVGVVDDPLRERERLVDQLAAVGGVAPMPAGSSARCGRRPAARRRPRPRRACGDRLHGRRRRAARARRSCRRARTSRSRGTPSSASVRHDAPRATRERLLAKDARLERR